MKYALIILVTFPVYASSFPLTDNSIRTSLERVSFSNDFQAQPRLEAFYRHREFFLNPVVYYETQTEKISYDLIGGMFIHPNWYLGGGVNLGHFLELQNPLEASGIFQVSYDSENFEAYIQIISSGIIQWGALFYPRWVQPFRLSLQYSNRVEKSLLLGLQPEVSLYFFPAFGYDFFFK